jgi:RNA polymerase sigma factor (sigma-70 family)
VEDVTRGNQRFDVEDRRFESFVTLEGQRLRRALIALYGVDEGCDACAEALAWAWENWSRLVEMANPVGYLFRVGQSSARRQRRRHAPISLPVEIDVPDLYEMDARLDEALVALSARQRVVAVLVHGYGYSYAEVAQITTTSVASVRNDLHRAMKRLRRKLEAR